MVTRSKRPRLRIAASAILITAAIGASAGPAAAQQAKAATQITPLTADLLLPPGYTRRGVDYVYEGAR